ncbi:2 oxo-3-deoxygalactonate 6-phosphate aldolase [Trichoderma sp. SZMC 28013]
MNQDDIDHFTITSNPIIKDVRPLYVGQFLFVRITTDNDIIGYGEGGVWGHIEAAVTTHHWNTMHRFSYFQGTAINAAISAIDIAFWDIKGKALGVPIYELLGGACGQKARVYGHIYEKIIEGVLAECRRKMDLGYTAFGHINPFLDVGHDRVYFKTHVKKMQDAAENVHRMRAVVGDKVDLLIELHRRLTPAEAITFGNMIKEDHPKFIEDPIRPENIDAMARVAEKMEVPVATGERYCTIYEFQAVLSRRAVEYVRIDVALSAMAEAHNVQVVPHNPLSPVGLAACLQLDACIPNFAIQEYSTGFESGVFSSTAQHLGTDVVDYVPEVKDGFVEIPSGPGLGINLLPNASDIRPPLVQPLTMRKHEDGFVVDQ